MFVRCIRATTVAVVLFTSVLTGAPAASATPPTSPAPEAAGTSDWQTLSAGGVHTCGIRSNRRLYCWGSNQAGQIGRGSTATSSYPTPVEAGGGTWLTVAAGNTHTCGIRTTRRLYCWGDDEFGQLGNGTTDTDQPSPVEVAGRGTNWTALSAGVTHTCARRATGRLYCWGSDAFGQLGNGPRGSTAAPSLVAGGFTNWTAVSVGTSSTCGRRANGRLYCWGDDDDGQLGNGAAGQSTTPSLVAGGITNWTSVSVGETHACGRRSNGRLHCWGGDQYGQLGNGVPGNSTTPRLVAGGATNWTSVATGFDTTCGRRSNGRLYCWGDDGLGQRGDGDTVATGQQPVPVAGNGTDWAQVTISGIHACAKTNAGRPGRVYCWGFGLEGRLGNGTTGTRLRPEEVFWP